MSVTLIFLLLRRWQGSSPLSSYSIVKIKERSYDVKHAHVMKYEVRKNESHKVEDIYECKLGSKFYMGPRRFPREAQILDRFELPPILQDALLIGRTVLETDLKIFILGDSLGWQFHNLWSETIYGEIQIKILPDIDISLEKQANGIVGYMRLNSLLLNSTEESMSGKDQHFWSCNTTTELLNWRNPGNNKTINAFDVLIYRIPIGWLTVDQITEENIIESLQLASRIFKVSSIVLVTPHFINNIRTLQEWEGLLNIRFMLHKIANDWRGYDETEFGENLKHITIFELGEYTDQIWRLNAQLIGYDITNSPNDYFLDKLSKDCYVWPGNIVHVCAEKVPVGQCQCKRNMLFFDGIHMCMSNLGPRMMATWACILECLYSANGCTNKMECKQCTNMCNRDFFTLTNTSDHD